MKILIASLILSLAGIMTSCTESHASSSHDHATPENGAQFKEGHGVSLTDSMLKSINLKTAEVAEENITPAIIVQLQTVKKGKEAIGWLTPEQAVGIKPGMSVDIKVTSSKGGPLQGKVLKVERETAIASGESEMTVELSAELAAGTPLAATILLDKAEGLTAVPKSALLTTAEGNFVYAKNGDYYVKTPIKTGAASSTHVEVLDGLYTGDEIVTSPVMSLWLAELQVLRGGKACTCGH